MREEHIVLVTIDRPEARNSADMEHFKQLRQAWERFRDDGDAWVAIVTGVGDSFFVGADLKSYIPEITKLAKEIGDKGLTEINGYRLDDGTKAVLRDFPLTKPVIAAVNGFCTAGGMEMLGGTDLRVCCPEAKFAVMEPKRGLFAGGGTTVRLPRQIPWAAAMEFLLCADLIPASRAYEMGVVNAVVAREQLLDTALEYARRITANAPLAVQATKASALAGLYVDDQIVRTTRGALQHVIAALRVVSEQLPATARDDARRALDDAEQLVKELRTAFQQESAHSNAVFRTEDAKEGPKAFAEKRPPVWQGR
jgi:enoyl-CoA hydratase